MGTVDVLRRFNRSYTQRIGVLEESFLESGRPLGPSRLLFEIGGGATVLELRARLGIDSGYLSRLLRHLEEDGLVRVERDPADGRRRIASLTERGLSEWHELDRRSDELAQRILEPLSEDQRIRLEDALNTADRLLRAATVTFEHSDAREPAAQWAMRSYFEELDARFPGGFDIATALADDPRSLTPPTGDLVLVRSDDDVVGCGGLVLIDGDTAEVKRMWVAPEWRGLGLARRLLGHLEDLASTAGRSRVVLDTNPVLTEAIAMYERAGYRAIERYNDNPYAGRWFEKRL